ncbi:hypothetical protein BGZ60DRAFT_384118 [Tricladium varicosporioides]|nr:hypothetical protein BGZ60DRAFT_384118 [Hymenoscyphus varicosporioides]
MPAPSHIISKIGDPIFAVFIGLSAAATRINREEKELGRSTQQTIDAGLRYFISLLPSYLEILINGFAEELESREITTALPRITSSRGKSPGDKKLCLVLQ